MIWHLKPISVQALVLKQSDCKVLREHWNLGTGEGSGLPTVPSWKWGARKTGVKQRKAARQVASLPVRLQSRWKMLILGGSKWRLALI